MSNSIKQLCDAPIGHGNSIAGSDGFITMKIPGLFQAGGIFTAGREYLQTSEADHVANPAFAE
jgi:indolepyruvate ferredoxin oxidoreductase alpha subunit